MIESVQVVKTDEELDTIQFLPEGIVVSATKIHFNNYGVDVGTVNKGIPIRKLECVEACKEGEEGYLKLTMDSGAVHFTKDRMAWAKACEIAGVIIHRM